MKPTLILTAALAALVSASVAFAAPDAEKKKKKKDGAKATAIFDGKTLEGWHQDDVGQATYEVVDGAIVGTTTEGSPNSFLLSDKEYGDFILTFQVKVDTGLNSGIQIRSRGKTQADVDAEAAASGKKPNKNAALGRVFGPQVEIESSPGQAGYVYGEATGLGWLSPEPQDKSHAHEFMKNDDWNEFRIVAKGATIRTFINGNKVAELTHEDVYQTHPKGHFGLQVHSIKAGTGPFQVRWRNLKIRETN